MFLYCLPVCLLGRTVYVVLSVLKSVVLYFVLSVVLSVSLSVVLVVLLLCCLIRCWWLPKCSLLCACKQANNFPRCHGASFAMMIPKPRLIHAHMCAEAKQRLSNLQFPSLPRAKHRFSWWIPNRVCIHPHMCLEPTNWVWIRHVSLLPWARPPLSPWTRRRIEFTHTCVRNLQIESGNYRCLCCSGQGLDHEHQHTKMLNPKTLILNHMIMLHCLLGSVSRACAS